VKIVHLAPYYYPDFGGGSAVSLFSLNNEFSNHKKIIISEGLNRKNHKNHIIISDNHEVFYYHRFSFKIYYTIFKECLNADYIQTSSFFFPPNFFAYIFSKIFKKNLIISPRGEFFEFAINKKRRSKFFLIKLFNLLISRVNFHATSDEEVKIIKKRIHNKKNIKIYKIPNSFESKFSFSTRRKRQILFLGRINPIKNIHSLFEILVNLNDVKYLIAGEAILKNEKNYLNFLKKEIKKYNLEDKVEFLGKLSGEKKFKIISTSKCLVLPSYSENFGNVVLESLSQSTPVIASHSTPWGVLEEFKCGFHEDFSLKNNLVNKINFFLEMDDIFFENLKFNCQNLLDKFSSKIIKDKWINLYNSN